MSGVRQIAVKPDEDGMRLDRWFKVHFPQLTHGRLSKLLRTGQVRVDGGRAKANERLLPGQTVRIPPLNAESSGREREKAAPKPLSAQDKAFVQSLILYR